MLTADDLQHFTKIQRGDDIEEDHLNWMKMLFLFDPAQHEKLIHNSVK